MIARPVQGTYAPYFEPYINLVGTNNPIRVLESLVLGFKALLSEIPEEKEEFRYAEGKWTVKEVIGHMIDTERIMTCRALCVARGEKQELPRFDENDYVVKANFNRRSLLDLGHEFGFVREATITFFKSLTEEDLDRTGIANKHQVTPRALLYIIAGHHLHHDSMLKEKYLMDVMEA
jgi:uncharacterized damage-inducible protein DinB